ncbi:hypothetical protein DFH28DRAFT_961954 [Melampsora americana]|nr:hypothetical protein DFH28DRAFT_961954 [Melampsora americana]
MDYLVVDDLIHDEPSRRTTEISYQSYDPFNYPLYQIPTQLSNLTSSTSQSTSIPSNPFHSPSSTHLSIPSSVYSEAYNSEPNLQSVWNIPNSNQSTLQSTSNLYLTTPSLSPPNHSNLNHTIERNPTGGTTSSSNSINPSNQNLRVTNQVRSNSINRGGSIRRSAPANKICETCGLGFTRNERLRYHVERVHLQVQPDHPCELEGCHRAFRQRSDLLRHQRTVHNSLS